MQLATAEESPRDVLLPPARQRMHGEDDGDPQLPDAGDGRAVA